MNKTNKELNKNQSNNYPPTCCDVVTGVEKNKLKTSFLKLSAPHLASLVIAISAFTWMQPTRVCFADSAEQVDVSKIKQKYWARGDKTELGVIQNRTYSKSKRFEITPTFGVAFSDPFLNDTIAGIAIGYHFSEYLALYAVGIKHMVTPSSALTFLRNPPAPSIGTEAQTNEPRTYVGAELAASLFYGKLSIFGKSIIYYDFHTIAGLGVTDTESGQYITPSIGLGQRFHLSKLLSLRVDYRMQYYYEAIREKVVTSRIGTVIDHRANWNNMVTVGLSFMIGE